MKGQHLFIIILIFLSGIGATFVILTMGSSAAPLGGPAWPTPTPAPLPPDVPFVPVPDVEAAALPDLVVTGIRIEPSTAIVYAETSVYVTVKNAGTVNVGSANNFYIDLYVDTDPYSGLRGIDSSPEGRAYPWGYAYSRPMTVPFGVQGFWFPAGDSVELSVTLVFTQPANYNLYARVDLPECAYNPPTCPCIGNVCEDNEDNNIYPTPSQPPEEIIVVAPDRVVERDHVNYMTEYASSLEELPISGTLGIPLTSGTGEGDSALVLGLFEEPPHWDVNHTADPTAPVDYEVLSPDGNVNNEITCDQMAPIIASDGVSTTDNLVVVWEDWRNGNCQNPDIYLNWATDVAATWQAADTRVNNDASAWPNWYQTYPAVAVNSQGQVVVAWQDNRQGNYDIYFQQYRFVGGTLTAVGSNRRFDLADPTKQLYDQIHPDIGVTRQGVFYLAWEDKRNNNSDIFAARGQVVGGVIQWDTDTMISDDPGTAQQVLPSINAEDTWVARVNWSATCPTYDHETQTIEMVVTYEISTSPSVGCVWQDFRNGADDPDIYLNVAHPILTPFGVDIRVNDDPPGAVQAEPAVDVGQVMKPMVFRVGHERCNEIPSGVTAYSYPEPIPVTLIHAVWQDYRNGDNDPDTYYHWISIEPDEENPDVLVINQSSGGLDGETGENYKVNSNDLRTWQTEPPWQGNPDIEVKTYELSLPPELDLGSDIYILWADGRNYDNRNYDIYMQFDDDPLAEQNQMGDYLVENNHVVNNNAKIHSYDPNYFSDYSMDSPPSAKQWRPSVSADLEHKGNAIFANTYVYVAWDDQRNDRPGVYRDVFFSRSNLTFFANWLAFDYNYPGYGWPDNYYGGGSYLSSAYDSGSAETTWYAAWWDAETPAGTYIAVQTRVADTIIDLLSANWYPEYPEGLAYPNANVPNPKPYIPLIGHNAPGQYIEGPGGQIWPTGRYIQYRINLWTTIGVHTPVIYDVSLFFTRGGGVASHQLYYLPLVVKGFRCAGETPNDPDYPKQWDMKRINADCAWAFEPKNPVLVAVVDSGVDYFSHPDLGHFVSGFDFHDWDSEPLDKCGHGTHVAGTVGAAVANNGEGIAGVYWEPRIRPMKVTGDNCGEFPMSVVAAAVGQAAEWGDRVINLSVGGSGYSASLWDAIYYARYTRGVFIAAAAGNDATDELTYPAAYPGVIGVSATNINDGLASYSNYGSYIDVAAPGGEMIGLGDPNGIYSTLPSYDFELHDSGYDYYYDYLQGTSMACPHVAGLAALIWGINPALTVDQVEYLILSTAGDMGAPGWDQQFGYGMIDAYRAATAARVTAAGTAPAETPPPAPKAVIDPTIAHVPGRVLVKFKSQIQAAEVDNLLAVHSATVSHQVEPIDVLVLDVPQGQEAEVATDLNNDPVVEYAELDYLMYLY